MPRSQEPDVAIRCSDVSMAYAGGTRAVDGVSFTLPHAGALAIMGPTGAGKSTLAAVLAGSAEAGLTVVGGDAQVLGISARRPGRAHRQWLYQVGFVAQGAGARLPARMTVGEVIGEPITSRDRRVNARALAVRIATLLDEMQLPLGAAAKFPYELSAGMRQRVAFARALVLQPRILIADEPLAGLDLEVRHVVYDAIVGRGRSNGMSALLVTNDADFARELNADVLVMRGGHVIAQGHGSELMWTPSAEAEHHVLAS
ncbi:MAG TPA: ATP-binding cassette domain-containing protein [Microbacterium sp.]|uniref:ATP-binding cassette domain-containing protein n=1 Tax=Microbacterium sp. TaxID=51671 RepID=UPI002BCE3425|nr:ATP-binding cassette domain-containing protein [Microbacterium sp.]HWI32232.1 ATP-binding cassette domain-containing protein [Microbacterium sp.]